MFLPPGKSNYFNVSITAANIAADAITNGGSLPEQDFALVIYNASLIPTPVLEVSDYTVLAENCAPTNGAIDPGETVTVNFALRNVGAADSTNLMLTLQESGGIASPSGPQDHGALLVGEPAVSRPFTFTTTGRGQTNLATFLARDGNVDLGIVTVPIPLGSLAAIYAQEFDAAGAANLPLGWSSSAVGAQKKWARSHGAETPPGCAFTRAAGRTGVSTLISPSIPLPKGSSRLIFQSKYNLESDDNGTAFDGGVLEIKIGSGDFVDIQDAGGQL